MRTLESSVEFVFVQKAAGAIVNQLIIQHCMDRRNESRRNTQGDPQSNIC